jgi:hypothetical protein
MQRQAQAAPGLRIAIPIPHVPASVELIVAIDPDAVLEADQHVLADRIHPRSRLALKLLAPWTERLEGEIQRLHGLAADGDLDAIGSAANLRSLGHRRGYSGMRPVNMSRNMTKSPARL